mmetsp:Transcript_22227/g.32338  ORF Transcript_22227/g.32338 Transcript_22227/m.32338 type:complete len:185 (+) Transcript_22227:46-600(+)
MSAPSSPNARRSPIRQVSEIEMDPWKIVRNSRLERDTPLSLSDRVYHVLQSETAHFAILGLLVLDILVVVTLITLHIEYLKTEIDDYEGVVHRCERDSPSASCDNRDYGNQNLYSAEKYLLYVSISILSVFIVENLALFLAKPAHFISSPLRVFDFAVVVVSLALEISLRSDPEGGLLIIARVW